MHALKCQTPNFDETLDFDYNRVKISRFGVKAGFEILSNRSIKNHLDKLEKDYSLHHFEHLKEKAALTSSMLTKINVDHIISFADHEPNFLDMFGETEDQVND